VERAALASSCLGVRALTHRSRIANPVPALALAVALIGVPSARSDEVAPPPPPSVDAPPPPPIPVTLEPADFRPAPPQVEEVRRFSYRPAEYPQAEYPQAEAPQPAAYQPAYQAADPYGFTAWLNGVRAQSGLGPVGFDPSLAGWAAANNGQQNARGLGHHVMGPARRQNSGMGGDMSTVASMWMASPPHQAALLDPSISWIGIAASGVWWTFNAY